VYDRQRIDFNGGCYVRKLIVLCVVSIFVFILGACSGENENEVEEETVTSVETEQIKKDNLKVEKSIYGTFSPYSQMPVMTEQAGEIKELKVKNGDNVSKDDSLATIKTPMGDTTVKATKDGKIAQLKAQEGDFQTNEDPFLMIIDVDKLKVSFAVSTKDKSFFKEDKKINIHIDDEKYKGTVLALDPLPNEAGQFDVEAKVENKDENITPGATGEIIMTETKVKDSLLVPTEAILQEADEDFIFIVEDGKAKRVAVEILETQTELSAIKGDVKEKDEVIVNGHFTLSDGSEVDVVKDGNEE